MKRWLSTSVLLFVFLNCCVTHLFAQHDNYYCYADDTEPYIHFATKSAYELVRAKKFLSVPSCKPVMIWASLRHGTRYPGKDTIEDMKKLMDVKEEIAKNHAEGQTQLCPKDLQMIRNWTYMLSSKYENRLSTQGKDDLRFLAKRLKSQFAGVLDTTYAPERFSFFNDGTERTVESTEAFIDGLFGPDVAKAHVNNTLLKSPDTCNAWVQKVKNNSETFKEYELFRQSTFVKNSLIADVSRRLGFRYNLTLEYIELMYDTCRYEKAWYISSRPPFCSAFSKDNLMILEYMHDLKYYYEFSYGNDFNKKLACPLLSDMVKRFNDIAVGNNKSVAKPLGLFYFSHSATHLPLLALLGMKEDTEHLMHSNYQQMSRREFTTSTIDPFTANLVAAFYKCSNGEENRVIFYLNEDVVRYPGCDVGLCSWDSFYSKFKDTVESSSCSFEFCNSGSSSSAASVKWFLSLSILIIIANFKFI